MASEERTPLCLIPGQVTGVSDPANGQNAAGRLTRELSRPSRATAFLVREGRLPVVLLAAYVVAFASWVLWAPVRIPIVNVLSNLGGLVPGAGAIWLGRRTAHEPTLAPPLRRGWRWLTWSFAIFWLGDVAFLLLKVAYAGGLVGVSLADVFYLASYPLALVGLLTLRSARRAGDERAAFWLDAIMVALGGGMLAWQLFVQPTLADPRPEMETVTAVAYVVADVTLVVALAITGLRSPGRVTLTVALLGLGLAVRFGANGLYWYDVLLGPPGFASAGAAALYTVAWLVFGTAAYAQRRAAAHAAAPQVAAQPGASLVPTAAAAVGLVVLSQAVARRLSLDMGVLVLVGVALTAAALARQLVAVRAGARVAAERAALANEARFRSLVENASDIILVVAEDAQIRFHTPSAERFFRREGHEIDETSLLDVVHPEDREVASALLAEAIARPRTTPVAEWRVSGDGGEWQFVEARATSVPGDPYLAGAVLTLRSIHERKVLEGRLAYQAFHDPLTNLANRVLFMERLEHALRRSHRGARPVTVVFIDLDDFKNVNDSLGHAAGDQLLVDLSQRLLGCVRAGDTAARLGGDEFAVVMEECGRLEEVWRIAERLERAARQPFMVAGREIVLSASLGIASSEGCGETGGDLLRNADVAMYQAKREGKGRVVLFEASMQTAVRERLEVEADLRGVVDRGELALVYQPIVALASGRIVGAEALLRWDHPVRGRLRPAEFFVAAESAEALPAIERWVVEEACRQAGEWPALDDIAQLPLLTINATARLLASPDLVQTVERAAAASGLLPGRLVLELTEAAAVEDAPTTFRTMRRLQAAGVKVAIDDFGTGYSSLSYLRDMPVDILKLDKVFVDGVADEPQAHLLTRGILDLARALGKLVVAEGIETEEQAARLREYGCTLGQGFLFSRPVEAGELAKRLAADAALLI
jgi:diguanylate cyclase (GGDEF)-like protein/PAS domain S-box-containing protein